MIHKDRNANAFGSRARPAGATCLAFMVLGALGLAGASGCIRSRVTITSEPAQAEVFFHGRPRGLTPIDIPYIWYWHHDIVVEKEGYERFETIERFRTPPWFLMPFDLFAELIPLPIPDHRYRHYVLKKAEDTL